MHNYIKQVSYLKNNITFGLPIIDTNYYNLKQKLETLPYELYCIQYRLLNNNKPFLNEFIKLDRKIYKIFLIKPTIINDIYELYFINGEKLEKYKVICVQKYKTSVMMNSLFRTIKENKNLDLLEESDDEEEFENINKDKYVNLNKTLIMKCVYSPRFRKWEPISIIKDKVKITTRKEAQQLEKKV